MVISNVDDDLFAATARTLGVELDEVVTAEQAGAYKPALRPFELAAERLAVRGVERGAWLHVAQSLHHDVAPARAFGLSTVWVNRRREQEGWGATPASDAAPDLEVGSLAELASR